VSDETADDLDADLADDRGDSAAVSEGGAVTGPYDADELPEDDPESFWLASGMS
jgi:hypothetical protein